LWGASGTRREAQQGEKSMPRVTGQYKGGRHTRRVKRGHRKTNSDQRPTKKKRSRDGCKRKIRKKKRVSGARKKEENPRQMNTGRLGDAGSGGRAAQKAWTLESKPLVHHQTASKRREPPTSNGKQKGQREKGASKRANRTKRWMVTAKKMGE